MNLDFDTALRIVRNKDKGRFNHILGTVEKAKELANRYRIDEYKCVMSAILHDYAKNEPLHKMKRIILNHLDKNLLKYDPVVYHGEVGSYLIKKDLGINDKDIIDAVKYHVTGHPDMNDIAKVVYIADYTEKNRSHENVRYARLLSHLSLDVGVLGISDVTLHYLKQKNKENIHPLTITTYESFLKKVGVKAYDAIRNHYKGM